MEDYKEIASLMCEQPWKDIPEILRDRIVRINILMQRCNARLRSRQLIALLIEEFYRPKGR